MAYCFTCGSIAGLRCKLCKTTFFCCADHFKEHDCDYKKSIYDEIINKDIETLKKRFEEFDICKYQQNIVRTSGKHEEDGSSRDDETSPSPPSSKDTSLSRTKRDIDCDEEKERFFNVFSIIIQMENFDLCERYLFELFKCSPGLSTWLHKNNAIPKFKSCRFSSYNCSLLHLNDFDKWMDQRLEYGYITQEQHDSGIIPPLYDPKNHNIGSFEPQYNLYMFNNVAQKSPIFIKHTIEMKKHGDVLSYVIFKNKDHPDKRWKALFDQFYTNEISNGCDCFSYIKIYVSNGFYIYSTYDEYEQYLIFYATMYSNHWEYDIKDKTSPASIINSINMLPYSGTIKISIAKSFINALVINNIDDETYLKQLINFNVIISRNNYHHFDTEQKQCIKDILYMIIDDFPMILTSGMSYLLQRNVLGTKTYNLRVAHKIAYDIYNK